MTDLLALSEREDELVPEILPVDARLSFSAQAYALAALFSSATDITPQKEIIPNTSYVRIDANDSLSEIEVSATDGERAITVIGPALVHMSGSGLLPGKRILDILRLAPENTVRIDVIGTTATIRSGRAVWTVQTPPSDAYLPVFPSSEIDWSPVPRQELLKSLELALPAVARSTARQSLMQAEIVKSSITACDGVRAHKVAIPSLDKGFKTTLPLRFIESAIKELKLSSEEFAYLWTDHGTVALALGKNRLFSQRLNFEFPAVNHLVLGPALQNDERLTVNHAELVSIIKRVRVNADPEFAAIFLSLRRVKGDWVLIVRARDKGGNASQESLSATYDGPATSKDIAVNHKYLLEFLSCLDDGDVEFRLGESTKLKQAPIYYESESFVGSLMLMAPNFVRS